ncbi:DUF1178 family protein [Novosphingobium sp. Leaf2]|uniref:DUF1178 family protein n=1 Tax=Novosphingobium sp. Leaf2 TaxID=1735670 RepID=UPI0006F922C9|nr:DUF1178 family protein [Novosphingobium sp. Leaf2]KQM13028.1 hypothetical protein ASE49_13635 [Novosphingobium sp. Leaf2]
MIVYDLQCQDALHRFEGWFKSSDDFVRQQERGLVTCPHCGAADVAKAVQAPRLARKGNQLGAPQRSTRDKATGAAPGDPMPSTPVANAPLPPQAVEMIKVLATLQAKVLQSSRYVGERFVDDARAMHYGEREAEAIHGQATIAEAQELLEEGIAVAPLPLPIVPPDQAN